ncbi:unnamed protein product [Durusdinium trenchii]|uniref:Ion transport domain-containing protein n=1 Tax=Durusdinium trenchii TaxID=1381693 RepID=A0ABP0LPS6_9DINO
MMRLLRLTRVARIARLLRCLVCAMACCSWKRDFRVDRGTAFCQKFVAQTHVKTHASRATQVFAIAFTQVAVDTDAGKEYFHTLPAAMFSLVFYGCFNNNMVEMARLCFQDDLVVSFLFAGFLLIAPLTVMNLLLGVLVEVVRVVATAEQEGRVVPDAETCAHHGRMALDLLYENEVGVDLVALVKDPNIIFDGEPYMAFQDFLDEILLLRGSNSATVKDTEKTSSWALPTGNFTVSGTFALRGPILHLGGNT